VEHRPISALKADGIALIAVQCAKWCADKGREHWYVIYKEYKLKEE